MNNDKKDNLLLVSASLKSWTSAFELISIVGTILGGISLISMYVNSTATDTSFAVLCGGLISITASAAMGLLIAKCLEAGSLVLQSLSIIHTEILIVANKVEK